MFIFTRQDRRIGFRPVRAENAILRSAPGHNPPAGAVIYFFLKDAPKPGTETKVEILDASGNVVRKYSSSQTQLLDEPPDPDDKKPEKEIKPEAGLNRFRVGFAI